MSDLNLRFLPWLRRGLARAIRSNALDAFATVDVGFDVAGEHVSRALRMRGPGDVIGIDPLQVLRTEPRNGAVDVEPNYFPCIEFAMPDLLWMFTPTAPDAEDRLLPWLTLVTVDTTTATLAPLPNAPLPVLTVPRGELPPRLDQMWAWAHVQTSELYAAGQLTEALSNHPDRFLSRLISPRNLAPDRSYLVCLVPTYQAGVLAGLGLPVPNDVGQAFAWTSSGSNLDQIELPVYYSWSFQTGKMGDFELLVERLEPQELDESVGRRLMDLEHSGLNVDALERPTAYFFGALVSPEASDQLDQDYENYHLLRDQLYTRLTAEQARKRGPYDYRTHDPVVTSPQYGRAQRKGEAIPPPLPKGSRNSAGYEPVWYGDVNLHPRTRGAAGIGARVVRAHQEEFVARAWQDAGELQVANQLVQQVNYAHLLAKQWEGRVNTVGPAERLNITGSLHARLKPAGESKTIRSILREDTQQPNAVFSAAYQRRLRSGSTVHHAMRLVTGKTPPTAELGIQHELRQAIIDQPERFSALSYHTLPPGAIVQAVDSEPEQDGSPGGWLDPSILVGQLDGMSRTINTMLRERTDHDELVNVLLTTQRLAASHVTQYDSSDSVLRKRVGTLSSRNRANRVSLQTNNLLKSLEAAQMPKPKQLRSLRSNINALSKQLLDPPIVDRVPPTAPPAPPEPDPVSLETVATALSDALHPTSFLGKHLEERILLHSDAISGGDRDIPSRFTMQLQFDDVIYPYIAEKSPEYLLPGVGEIPQNTVGLVQVNSEFVEAVLVGVNHEMSRELRWREFPTVLSSTWFKHFWDQDDPDIADISGWAASTGLGEHQIGKASDDALVLLIKGELLQRYPNVIIYALKATMDTEFVGGEVKRVRVPDEPEEPIFPVFSGELEHGVQFFGFSSDELTISKVLGSATPDNQSTDGGYFFAMQEQPSEPRFGLDEYETGANYRPNVLPYWSELSWGHFMPGNDPDKPTYVGLDGDFQGITLPDTEADDAPRSAWGSNAAMMARIVLQRPVRVLIHASAMLPER